MTRYAERAQARWRDGARVDMHAEMMRLTLAIAGRTLFDADVESEAHDVAEAMELSLRMFGYAILPFGMLMEWAPLRWVRDLHRARRRLDALIFRMVADRRASGGDRGDLLSMLIEARDAEGDGSGMSDQQLRDEIVTLLMAGHETTANALTWTWYLLSRHPRVEARLHDELTGVLGARLPTAAAVPRLEYTRSVIAEAMRLYPPAWMIERRPLEDFEAGGYIIPSGTIVLMSQYLVHRDPRWWSEPQRFDPDRWTPECQSLRPKFAYFPFGGGARMCIGEHFAWMEEVLVLATIAQRWRMRYDGTTEPEPEPLVTLRPRDGMPMRLEQRASG
jgi:cytochrome P450